MCTTWAKQLIKLVTRYFVQLPVGFKGSAIQPSQTTNQQDKTPHLGCHLGVFATQHKAFWDPLWLETLCEDTHHACSEDLRRVLVGFPHTQAFSLPPPAVFFHTANMLVHPGTTIHAATWWPGSGNWSELKIAWQKKRLFLTQLGSPVQFEELCSAVRRLWHRTCGKWHRRRQR